MTTEEIARAFLLPAPTVAQRIVRAKTKIRYARIPYSVPEAEELAQRLGAVLHTIYLVFNEGYSSAVGADVTRTDFAEEAIRLGRFLVELLPSAEAIGLLALMLLHDARRMTRLSRTGDLVLLEHQDRAAWNRDQIQEAVGLVERALATRPPGSFAVQAAIAALHAEAPTAAETDWRQISALYDVLFHLAPSPVVELNRAVARAMFHGPEAGLASINALLASGALTDYAAAHIARAELLRRSGKFREAIEAYSRAKPLARAGPERRFLEDRRRETEEALRRSRR